MSNKRVTIIADNVDPDELLEQYRALLTIETMRFNLEQWSAMQGIFELLETIFESRPDDFPTYGKGAGK